MGDGPSAGTAGGGSRKARADAPNPAENEPCSEPVETSSQDPTAATSQAAPQQATTEGPQGSTATEHELYCGRCNRLLTSTNPVLTDGGTWFHGAHVLCYMCTRPSDATMQDWGRCPLCVQTPKGEKKLHSKNGTRRQ